MVELILSFAAGLALGWLVMPRSNAPRHIKNPPLPLDYTRID